MNPYTYPQGIEGIGGIGNNLSRGVPRTLSEAPAGGWLSNPNMGAMYTNTAPMNIQTTPITPYTHRYSSDSAIGGLMAKIGGLLRPQNSFSNTQTYGTYAAPQREVFNQWVQNTYRPEFERFTMNPYLRNQGNIAAARGMEGYGYAPSRFRGDYLQTMQPYYNNLEQAQGSFEDMIRKSYEDEMKKYYESPTAFNNI